MKVIKENLSLLFLATVIWFTASCVIIFDIIVYFYQLMEALFWAAILFFTCIFGRAWHDMKYRNR